MSVVQRADTRARGILLMSAAVFCFSLMDTIAKYLATRGYPVIQIVWARYAFSLIVTAVMLRGGIPAPWRTRRLFLQAGRSVLLLLSTFLFFTAISYVPLADAMAVGFVGPVLVTAFAALMLHERVDARRWGAVLVAFLGVLVVIRPGFGAAHWALSLPLGVAFCFALYQIATRVLSRTEHPATTLFYTGLVGVFVPSLIVPFYWVAPDPAGWALLVVLGLFGGLSHWIMIRAYGMAPASVLAPFNYTSLVWGVLFGFLLFADLPDGWTLLGAGIIAACGLYVLALERHPKVAET